MEKTLDAYDVSDKERYFLPPQAAPAITGQGAPPGQQQPQQQQLPPGPPPGAGSGLTNVDAAAGPLSPNSPNSMSPENAMATMLRSTGGASNGGGGGS